MIFADEKISLIFAIISLPICLLLLLGFDWWCHAIFQVLDRECFVDDEGNADLGMQYWIIDAKRGKLTK